MKLSIEVEYIERVDNEKWEGVLKVEFGLFWDICEIIKGKY